MAPKRPTPVTLICPRLTCRAILQVPESVRGQRVRCGECGMALMVPPAGSNRTVALPARSQAPDAEDARTESPAG